GGVPGAGEAYPDGAGPGLRPVRLRQLPVPEHPAAAVAVGRHRLVGAGAAHREALTARRPWGKFPTFPTSETAATAHPIRTPSPSDRTPRTVRLRLALRFSGEKQGTDAPAGRQSLIGARLAFKPLNAWSRGRSWRGALQAGAAENRPWKNAGRAR